ncbi:MAG: ABC transporter substrate binding protein [Desulfosarcinaceae bacterium]
MMKHKLAAIFLIMASLLWLPGAVHAKATGTEKYNVLFLNSYQYGYRWSDDILNGVKAVIDESGLNVDLNIEYMDTKVRYDKEVKMHLFALYAHKYRNVVFDAVIVADNNGFDFYLQFHDKLFPNVPTIFCGVNDFSPQSIAGLKHISGVIETFDIKTNLELAQKFHPDRKKFVVIEDDSTTAKAIKSEMLKALNKMSPVPQFQYLQARALDQLVRDCKAMADDAVFYIIPFYTDDPKGRNSANEIVQTLYKETQAPFYSNWEFLLGSGIVGGKVIDGYAHGKAAGQMVVRVLEGENVADIPIVKPNDEPIVFDNILLEKFHINRDELPPGSTLINRTAYFFEVGRPLFWFLVGGVILGSATLIFLMFNISQRQVAENKLKDQLAFVRQLMNAVPIPIYFRNEAGKFTGVNSSFETWFSVEREKILAGESLDGNGLGPAQLVDEVDNELLGNIGIRTYEKCIQLDDRNKRDVILHKATYTNTKKQIVGIVGAIYDITQRKTTENKLRESRQMLQLVLDNIPQHVHWKDKNLKYLGVNRSFGNFFGLKNLSGVIGKTDHDIVPDKHVVGLSTQTDQQVVREDRGVYGVIWSLQRRPDDKVWLKINRVPLHDQEGEVVGVLSTAEDITQNVLFQNKLIETTKIEAIGTLAGGIAHDFNNILTSIINSTELALEDVQGDTIAAEDLRRSLKAARRGSRLVKKILTFSRADKEGIRPTRLAEVVEEAVALTSASLPRNIEIKTRIDPGLGQCLADPTQMHQVVMNLLTNAFQALKDTGGMIQVELNRTEADEDTASILDITAGPCLHLAIEDNGPGIPPDIMDKIFDPFFTTKPKGEGTGLGLAVVHGIVKGHNGAIRVSSLPGRQTTKFEITLPLLNADTATADAEDLTIFKGDESILFVEDDEDQIAVIPRVLGQLGYQVHTRRNGKEAGKCLEENKFGFDLVITDYDMPELNGLQLARKIEAFNPRIPVIIVTGRKPPEDMQEQAGNIRRLIRKPYNKAIISRVIREVLACN